MKASYLRTLKYMISQGMSRDRALLCVSHAFGLTPDATVKLARAVGL